MPFVGRARLLPSRRRPQVGDRRMPQLKPPADTELKLVLGSAGASPSLFKHALTALASPAHYVIRWHSWIAHQAFPHLLDELDGKR